VRPPSQPDLIQRKLFTIAFHAYASSDYLKMYGTPKSSRDLQGQRLLSFGGKAPNYMQEVSWLSKADHYLSPNNFVMTINNISALVRAVESGIGIAVLPDYLVSEGSGLVRIMTDENMPLVETFFVYPEELKNVARVQVFRDFMVSKAQKWTG
jgi:DNA-binding transcriptional LysR family regulator